MLEFHGIPILFFCDACETKLSMDKQYSIMIMRMEWQTLKELVCEKCKGQFDEPKEG